MTALQLELLLTLGPQFQTKNAKKYVSSRSIQKGAMWENRFNQNLTIKQEYARSGHTGPEMRTTMQKAT
jgi:hypothetical protein